MKLFVISDNTDTLVGMNLAGVEGELVHEENEFEKVFKRCLEDENVGVVAVTHKLKKEFGHVVNKHIASGESPLVIEIPDRHITDEKYTHMFENIKDMTGLVL